jgi:hypothetical protein
LTAAVIGWPRCVVRGEEAGIGTGGVVGRRAAVSSGDGGAGRSRRERGRGRGPASRASRCMRGSGATAISRATPAITTASCWIRTTTAVGTLWARIRSMMTRIVTSETMKTPRLQGLRGDGRGGFRTCDLSRVKGLDGVSVPCIWLYSVRTAPWLWSSPGLPETHWARYGYGAGSVTNSWVRCICSVRSRLRGGRASAP